MNSWLTKLRIASAMDSGKALPGRLRKAIDGSRDLTQFEANARELERRLKEPRREATPQPFLHEHIMRAVARAGESTSARRSSWRLVWLTAPATALVLAVSLWSLPRPAPPARDAQALAAVSSTLDLSQELTRTAAGNLLAPLSDELDRVNHDLDTTTQFLLASVP